MLETDCTDVGRKKSVAAWHLDHVRPLFELALRMLSVPEVSLVSQTCRDLPQKYRACLRQKRAARKRFYSSTISFFLFFCGKKNRYALNRPSSSTRREK
jgi:hypothetical protein